MALSGAALAGTIGPPVLYLARAMPLADMKTWMAAAAIVWFVVTPFWMDREKEGAP